MSKIYEYPLYYEIAFSFRDIAVETSVIEECISRFSQIPVKTVLELGCGNCPHTSQLCERGYKYVGIDTCSQMIEFSRRKTEAYHEQVEIISANMNNFRLDEPVEFVFIQVGSLLVANNEDIANHFDSVAQALRPGGLYFLDGCITFDDKLADHEGVTWELKRDGIKVKTNVIWSPISRAKQLFSERHVFEVDDNGKRIHIEGAELKRAIYPQEFLQIVRLHPKFEFVGWWHLWNLEQPLEEVESPDRAIALIRRI